MPKSKQQTQAPYRDLQTSIATEMLDRVGATLERLRSLVPRATPAALAGIALALNGIAERLAGAVDSVESFGLVVDQSAACAAEAMPTPAGTSAPS